MTAANDLREALARVVVDQRRDADLIVNDILATLQQYGEAGWICPECDEMFTREVQTTVPHRDRLDRHGTRICNGSPVPMLVLPLPGQEPRPRGGSDG